MADDELIALEHENWIAYLTGVVSCTSRANVTRTGGTVAILSGLPFDWFNQILVEHERRHLTACSPGWPGRASEETPSWFVCVRASMIASSLP